MSKVNYISITILKSKVLSFSNLRIIREIHDHLNKALGKRSIPPTQPLGCTHYIPQLENIISMSNSWIKKRIITQYIIGAIIAKRKLNTAKCKNS